MITSTVLPKVLFGKPFGETHTLQGCFPPKFGMMALFTVMMTRAAYATTTSTP